MKTKVIATALFFGTVAAVAGYPAYQNIGVVATPQPDPVVVLPQIDPLSNERLKVEVVFVLDTTGSMAGLIQTAKEKIWSIATTMARADPAPEIRMGLVAYRDRGDDYVTRVVDLSGDLDSMYATLMDFRAEGGGDDPESVNQALYDAVHDISWSQDDKAYQVVFLVGDAPPHMNYQDDMKYPKIVELAKSRGITVNTIQCGNRGDTTRSWQHVAQLGDGRYFQVEQSGGAVAIATPFDKKLAELSAKLDETRLYYGTDEEKEIQKRKVAATEKLHADSSIESRARRAAFNASASGKTNLLGKQELIDDVTSGRVDLSEIDRDSLPEPMQVMAPTEQTEFIEKNAAVRDELSAEIQQLVDKRDAYLRSKVEEEGGADESLDNQLFGAIRAQAKAKGLRYNEKAPAY